MRTAPSANLAKTNAPLYLVTYPIGSTVDTNDPLNCYTEGAFDPTGTLPYNCDHAQVPGIKGHDHLVGVRKTSSNLMARYELGHRCLQATAIARCKSRLHRPEQPVLRSARGGAART